jgi:hypothetical protein
MTDTLIHLPLASAHLCLDCESVGNDPHRCPACAGTTLMNLGALLNPREAPTGIAKQHESDSTRAR